MDEFVIYFQLADRMNLEKRSHNFFLDYSFIHSCIHLHEMAGKVELKKDGPGGRTMNVNWVSLTSLSQT